MSGPIMESTVAGRVERLLDQVHRPSHEDHAPLRNPSPHEGITTPGEMAYQRGVDTIA